MVGEAVGYLYCGWSFVTGDCALSTKSVRVLLESPTFVTAKVPQWHEETTRQSWIVVIVGAAAPSP